MRRVGSCYLAVLLIASGCCRDRRASITAVPLSPWNQCEPEGIPYYLPKPLLVVAKNVRHIDESKVGLTNPAPIPNAFDNQAAYGDIKANVTVPGSESMAAVNAGSAGLPSAFDPNQPQLPDWKEKMTPAGRVEDGIAPDSFYTYQIVFVPDLSQKYGLRIKGGPGEIRAAMNLVNGWMYTGMGPFYLKDSSRAQNIMAAGVGSMFAGRGVADVLDSVGNLAKIAGEQAGKKEKADVDAADLAGRFRMLTNALMSQRLCPQKMCNYAEVHIYEPETTPDGAIGWKLVAEHSFDREYFQPDPSPETLKLLDSIVKAQENETAARREAILKQTEERKKKESADAEETIQGQQGGGTTPPSAMNLPDAVRSSMFDQKIDQVERKLMGLQPQAGTAVAPSTQVNVRVNSDDKDGHWLNRARHPFRRRTQATHETRSTNVFVPAEDAGLLPQNMHSRRGAGNTVLSPGALQ